VVLGVPEYWSPEQATGAGLDPRSDIYSLGVVLYESLSGKMPFSSHSFSDMVDQHLHVSAPPLTIPGGDAPADLVRTVHKCLKKEPGERFASAADLDTALASLDAGAVDDAPTMTHVAQQATGRGRTVLAFASSAILALAVTVLWPAPEPEPEPEVGPREFVLPLEGPLIIEEPVREDVAIELTSEPVGAVVYAAAGGSPLGRTPVLLALPRDTHPTTLVFRFPDGERTSIDIVPDRPSAVHVEPKRRSKE
jgi:hypothetical protein